MWLIWILNYSVFSLPRSLSLFLPHFHSSLFFHSCSLPPPLLLLISSMPTLINTRLISLSNFLIHQFIYQNVNGQAQIEWSGKKECCTSKTHKEIEIHISSCKLSILWVLIKAWSGRESYAIRYDTIWKNDDRKEKHTNCVCTGTTVQIYIQIECMEISFILNTPPCRC